MIARSRRQHDEIRPAHFTLRGQANSFAICVDVRHARADCGAACGDGAIQQNWLIGARSVQLTAYGQAAALSLSAAELDFGTQYTAGLRLPRYLYLSNNSATAIAHTAVTLPGASPFSVTDRCPGLLEPLTVCQLQLAYQAAHTPSADAVTLTLDQGLSALVTGKSLPQPSANGASVNPNLSVSASSLNFATAVVVTGVSSSTQTLTLQNTGGSAFALAVVLTGDFNMPIESRIYQRYWSSFTNAFTAMANAHLDRTPVLFLTSSAPLREAELNVLQSGIDQVAAARTVTRWAVQAARVARIPALAG